jgi:hypothetical protein
VDKGVSEWLSVELTDNTLWGKGNRDIESITQLRHVTGLWTWPVIRYRPVTGPDQITTSPARAGTGEPLHRLEPVPVRGFTGTGSPVGRFNKWQTWRRHRTKSVGLYHPTQRTHMQLSDLCKSLLEGTLEAIMWAKWGSPSIPLGRGDLHITHPEVWD